MTKDNVKCGAGIAALMGVGAALGIGIKAGAKKLIDRRKAKKEAIKNSRRRERNYN